MDNTKIFLLLALLLFSVSGFSQDKDNDLCYQLYSGISGNIKRSELMETNIYPLAGLRLGVNTRPTTSSQYAAFYNYPTLGIEVSWTGLEYVTYHQGSHLENLVTLNGFFEGDIFHSDRWFWGYNVGLGAGFNAAIYDPDLNPLNTLFASPLLIYAALGLNGKYHINKHWEVGAALRFGHYSTGRLAYPNTGLNQLVLETSIRYFPQGYYYEGPNKKKDSTYRKIYAEFGIGGGLHRCASEWRAFHTTHPWPNFTQNIMLSYQFKEIFSLGLNIDASFCSDEFMERTEEVERTLYGDKAVENGAEYDKTTVGLSLVPQFHYGNFVLFGAFGAYLYRHYGLHEQEGKVYQKAGIKLHIPRLGGLFVAADCLAHDFSRAAMIEFSIGYRI